MYKIFFVFTVSILIFLISACDSNTTGGEPSDAVEKTSSQQVSNALPIESQQKTKLVAVEKNKLTTPSVSKPEKTMATKKLSGEQVYNNSCRSCHAAGVAGAPKLGDAKNWKKRINKGVEVLYISAIKGVPATAMPPKGACAKCSDSELKAAVDFMLSKVN